MFLQELICEESKIVDFVGLVTWRKALSQNFIEGSSQNVGNGQSVGAFFALTAAGSFEDSQLGLTLQESFDNFGIGRSKY